MEEDRLRQSVIMHSVGRYNLPGPLETPSTRQPGPESQSGYYSVQQRTLNQWNAPQSLDLSSGHSFTSPPQSKLSLACLQSSPVNKNHPLGPQQTLSNREPGPESQSGYYSVQQRTLNQWNAPQSLGLSSGHSFTSPPQSNSSSACLQSSPVSRTHPLAPQQTLSCREPGPTSHSGYYSPQRNVLIQKSNLQGFSNGNSFSLSSQPSSGSANTQVGFTGPQSQLNFRTPASFAAPCPKDAVQFQQLPAAHLKAPAVNLNYYPQLPHKNTTFQDYKNMTPLQNMNCYSSWFPSNGSSENNKVHDAGLPRYQHLREKHNRMQTLHQPAEQPQQTSPNDLVSEASWRVNINQGQMRVVRNGATYSCAPRPGSVTQMAMAPSLPPSYRGSRFILNSFLNHRAPPLNRPPGSFVQRESEQLINQSSSTSLSQHTEHLQVFEEKQTRQAVSVPRHHSKKRPTLPAPHCSRGPQDLQSNSTTGVLTKTSPASGTSPTVEAPHSDCSASAQSLWKFQQQNDGQIQGPDSSPLFSSSTDLRAQATESKGGHQQPATADHTASVVGDSRTQASVSNCSIPPNPSKTKITRVDPVPTKRTVISIDESAHSSPLKAADVEGSQSSRGSCIILNSYLNHRASPLNRPPGSFVQRESEQLINQSSSTSLPQRTEHLQVFEERQTRQAVSVPRHHSKKRPTLPAPYCSRGPQDLQSNSTTGVLTKTSPASGTSPTGEAPHSDCSASAQSLWKFQQQNDGQIQGPDSSPLFSSSTDLRAQATESNGEHQQPATADHTASVVGDSRTQATVSNCSIPPNPSKTKITRVDPVPTKRTVISIDESAHSSPLKAADVEGSQSSRGSCIILNSYLNHRAPPLNRPPGSFVQRESEQLINQSSSTSLPQRTEHLQVFEERQTRQAVPVPRHHSKNLPTLPAPHCSRGPQDLQSNSTTGMLTKTSPTSGTSPTGEAPHSDSSASAQSLWKFQQQNDGQIQGPDSSPLFSSSGLRAQATESKGGHQQPATADHTASVVGDSRTQASVSNCSIPPNPSKTKITRVDAVPTKRTVISIDESAHSSPLKAADVEGSQSNRLQDSQTESRDGQMSDEGHREVEHCTEPAECLELVIELQKAVHQVHRSVVVVPPISQQSDPLQKEDVITTTNDSLPLKIDAVWTLAKDCESVEMENNAPKELKELSELQSVPQPQTQESIKHGNDSVINTESCTMPSSTSGSLSVGVPQTESGPISKSQSSKASQAPVCVNDLTAENPVQQNNDLNVESCTHDSPFHLSTVPGIDFTLEKLQQLIKTLEATPAEKGKKAIADVMKCILDLYWGGDIRNTGDKIKAAGWTKIVPKMCIKEKQGVVLQFLEPENLRRLSCHCHILQEDIPLPAKEFRSSWWNENPPDIDKVLAEPISDYDFTWCKDDSESVFDVNPIDSLAQPCGNDAGDLVVANQKQNSEITLGSIAEQSVISDCLSEPGCSPEVLMPATADHQVDVIKQEEHVCESKSDTSKSFKKQTSKNQEDIQQHHEQDQQLQGFLHSNEIPGSLTKSSNEIKCEKGHRNAGKEVNSPKAKPKDLTAVKTQKDNEQMHPESPVPTSHLNPSDHVEDDGSCENDPSTIDPLPHIIVLSSDDATLIFEDCDEQEKSTQSCQVDLKVLTMFSLSGNREIWSHGPPSHVKLTCPHVTDIIRGTDHFCPKCWNETPLLDIDLDESLFSSKEGGPNGMSSPIKPGDESCSPQPGKLTEPLCVDNGRMTESDLFIPKVNGPEATRASESSKTGRQSSSPQSSVPPVQEPTEPLCQDNSGKIEYTKLVKKEICLVKSSVREKLPEALPHSEKPKLFQTKTSSLKNLAGKKRRLSKSGAKPADYGSKGQSSRNERKERKCKEETPSPITIENKNSPPTEAHSYSPDTCLMSQVSNATEPPPHQNVTLQRLEGPEHSAPSDDGQERDVKNAMFLLHGSQSRDFQPPCHSRQKFPPAPVPNVSAASNTGPKYTGMPLAKQKGCNKSCDTFVQKQNNSLGKEGQNDCEILLKNRIEIQKKIMRERSIWKASKEKNELRNGLKHKGDDSTTQRVKKLKFILTNYGFE